MIRTLILSLFILPIVHDFHFSRTKAHYNSTTNTLQMSMNIFTELASHSNEQTIIEGCGHWIQQEAPQEVNRLILEFLKQL